MHSTQKSYYLAAFISIFFFLPFLFAGCGPTNEPIVVYAGKGLKNAMEEIKQTFELQKGIPVSIVYAGSNTLLTTIQKTGKGDIFIPGSQAYIKKAGAFVVDDYYVGLHIPAFAVHSHNSGRFKSFSDLLKPGVRIAVANKDMAAIGMLTESMLNSLSPTDNFRENIIVKGSTVNELLQLINSGNVDAVLIWKDMLQWENAKELRLIELPEHINQIKEIRVAVLSTSSSPERARLFANFVADKGKEIFLKHGFGKE